jgi:hypothetical protein
MAALGCAPAGEAGFCDEAEPCPGRGQVCDTVSHLCMTETLQVESTEDNAPSDFTDKVIPFFRGQMCVPTEVESGSLMPASITACMHPCIVPTDITFRHFFECIGSSCEAFATMWVVADSAPGGCPPDAFSRFDRSNCEWQGPAEFQIDTSDGPDGDIVGSMLIEVPYLTNADMERLVDADLDQDLTREVIEAYPQDAGRIPGERAVWILPDNPAPPESCLTGDGCTCFDIGF